MKYACSKNASVIEPKKNEKQKEMYGEVACYTCSLGSVVRKVTSKLVWFTDTSSFLKIVERNWGGISEKGIPWPFLI